MTKGAKEFLTGKKSVLYSEDIDPIGTKKYKQFEKAILLKRQGKIEESEEILTKLCMNPSIYHGHYRELFKLWRIRNRNDINNKKYESLDRRIRKMLIYDNNMIEEMLKYWSIQQNRRLPEDYFNGYRNISITDIKNLLISAEKLRLDEDIVLARKLLIEFRESKV